jgi:hypothetical protein
VISTQRRIILTVFLLLFFNNGLLCAQGTMAVAQGTIAGFMVDNAIIYKLKVTTLKNKYHFIPSPERWQFKEPVNQGISIEDIQTGQLYKELKSQDIGQITDVRVISSDSLFVHYINKSNYCPDYAVWNYKTGALKTGRHFAESAIAAISPDQKYLLRSFDDFGKCFAALIQADNHTENKLCEPCTIKSPMFSCDSKKLAYFSHKKSGETNFLNIYTVGEAKNIQISLDVTFATLLAWSPTGNYIAGTLGFGNELNLWRPDGKLVSSIDLPSVGMCYGPLNRSWAPVWMGNDKILVFFVIQKDNGKYWERTDNFGYHIIALENSKKLSINNSVNKTLQGRPFVVD